MRASTLSLLALPQPIHVSSVERKKEQFGDSVVNPVSKKLGKQEEQLKANSRDLNMVKMKSMVAIGLTFTALMGMFNTM